MGIHLPKYTIQEHIKQPSIWRKLIFPFAIIFSLALGYFANQYFSKVSLQTLKQQNISLEEINSNNNDTIAQMQTHIQQLETNKQIKQEALLELQQSYKESIDFQNQLKSEINFYERLLSPNAENKGLRVFETALTHSDDNNYNLKITLVQKLEKAKVISGKISITVIGLSQNKTQTIHLTESDKPQYEFKYFENITFKFSLPDSFKPQQLVVKLNPKSGKSVDYSIDWISLINQEQNNV